MVMRGMVCYFYTNVRIFTFGSFMGSMFVNVTFMELLGLFQMYFNMSSGNFLVIESNQKTNHMHNIIICHNVMSNSGLRPVSFESPFMYSGLLREPLR